MGSFYTYAVLELSPAAYREISEKLREGGHDHAFQDGPGGMVIDMSGLAVKERRDRLSIPTSTRTRTGALIRNAARRDGTLVDHPRREFLDRDPRRTSPAVQETDVSRGVLSIKPGTAYRDARTPAPEGVRIKPDPEPIPRHPPVPEPPPPLPQEGVRIAVRRDDGSVLAVDLGDGDGCNLPGGPVGEKETPREAAARLLEDQAGLETDEHIEVWSGEGDKYRLSHVFVILADNDIEPRSDDGIVAEFVKIPELLCGQWGLAARDALNAAGWMKRPRMDLEKLYEVCRCAIRNGDNRAEKGTDMVIDEVTFLTDVGKLYAVDEILRDVDVAKLHPDVADALLVMVEPLEGLRHKEKVVRDVEILLEAVDGPRTPIRFMGHDDVRAAARSYYRKKAAEFGRMLRDGTLAQKFGGRHRGGKAIRTDVPDDAKWPLPDAKDAIEP